MDFSKLARKGIDMLSTLNQSSTQSENDISMSEIIGVLKNKINFPISILRETQYVGDSKEEKVQKNILKQLQDIYGKERVQKEYNVGGYWGMRCDIDLFDGKIGIELKVAEQLKKSANVERLIGQTVYYAKRKYGKGNLIVLVVGKRNEYDASMKEIETIVTELGANFLYKSVD